MSRFRAVWQASLSATKKALTWNVEDLIPPSERYIFSFNSKEELKKWHLYSDSEYGGLSSASLEITDTGNGLSGIFSGNLSRDVTKSSKWNISRSGFCGMRSKKFDGFIDLDPYDTIALKLKGDGRCYISTIYTENWVNSPGQQEDNSWQAFVFVPKDNWYIAKIPLARYLPTWRGNVIDAQLEMNPSRVLGMSLSVNAEGGVPGAKSGPGDFRVEIDWIKALRTETVHVQCPAWYFLKAGKFDGGDDDDDGWASVKSQTDEGMWKRKMPPIHYRSFWRNGPYAQKYLPSLVSSEPYINIH